MFTKSCFIRKNTPELKEKLMNLGYNVDNIKSYSECIATSIIYDIAIATGISEDSFDSTNPHRTWNCAGRIDCKDNEELFLALVSLRDDTDLNQWFVYPEKDMWFTCDYPDIEVERNSPSIKESCQSAWFYDSHKATAEELIKHFRK